MPATSLPTAIMAGAGIGAGGSLLSGVLGAGAAQTAAAQQSATARRALDLQQQTFGTISGFEQPFIQYGTQAAQQLADLTGVGTSALQGPLTRPFPALQPFAPTQAQLAQTPGYQFVLGQGLQGVQNSYAAQGLGSSGAALKGAANFAEGLAGTTFQQQFQNYLQQQQQQFGQYWQGNQNIANILGGQAGLGASAGSTLSGSGVNLANQSTSSLNVLGGAQASGTIGAANAGIGGLTGATNSIAGALPSLALAPYTTAALANLSGLYGPQPGSITNTGLPF